MRQVPDRDHILSHGLGVASARGLDALSIGELARNLDVERSGLIAHFSSKTSLQLGVLGQAAEMFQNDVILASQGAPEGIERIRTLFERWLTWSLAPRLKGGCPFVHASNEAQNLPADVQKKLREFLDQWTQLFTTSIEAAKQDGVFDKDLDGEQLIFEIYGLYLSHHFWHWSMKNSNAKARTLMAFERLLDNAKIDDRTF